MKKDQLLSYIKDIRKDQSSEECIINSIDKLYAETFNAEKESVCDGMEIEIEKMEIDDSSIANMIINYGVKIKSFIEERIKIEFVNTKEAVIARAKINAAIDALSSMQTYLSTVMSELARRQHKI